MVGRWGMSEAIGPIAVIAAPTRGPAAAGRRRRSREHTQELIDSEVRRIVDEAYQKVIAPAHREPRQARGAGPGAAARRETLDEHDAYAAAGIERIADEPDAHGTDGHAGVPAPPAGVAIDYPGSSSHPLGEETP